jgi:hypothetical protein
MDVDPLKTKILQPALFDLGESSKGAVELFPAVWAAAEGLAHPEVQVRANSLQRLEALGAARLSPLVAYLLATRIMEPELPLRSRVIRLLAGVLQPDANGDPSPQEVRQHLIHALSQMRTRRVYCLLEALAAEPAIEADLVRLFSACSFAGTTLVELLGDRCHPLPIRFAAARMIGSVGYLEALPAVERLKLRLEARSNGQQAMPFAPPDENDEVALLPAVQHAAEMLKKP